MVNRYGSPYVSPTTSRSPSPVRSDEKPPSGWNSEDEPAPAPDYEAIATKAKLLDFLGNTGEAQRCFEDPYSAEIFIELMHVKAGIELKEEDRERAIDFFERNAVYLGEIPIDWTATEFVVYSGWGHLLSGRDRSGASVLDRAILEGNKPLSLWLLEQNVTLSSLPSLDAKFMPQKKVLTGAMAPPPSIATAETRKAYWAEQHRIIEEAYTPLTLSEQTATLGFDTLAYALDMIDDPEVLGAVFSAAGELMGVRNQWGETPMTQACGNNGPGCVRLLLDSGADRALNEPNARGRTPLMVAASRGNAEIVELLMETREVDPDQKNQHRESARSLLDPNAPQYARIKAALKSEKQRMELARLNDDLERLKRQPGWSFYYGLPDESGRGFENGEQYKLQLIEEYREKIQRLEQGDFSDSPRYTSRKESDSDSDDPKRYYMGNQD